MFSVTVSASVAVVESAHAAALYNISGTIDTPPYFKAVADEVYDAAMAVLKKYDGYGVSTLDKDKEAAND